MAINLSGLEFFMPVFSFLFVFLIVYVTLGLTKVLGESSYVHFFIAFIIAIVFISASSFELYIKTILPWVALLFVVVFLILLIGGFAGGKLDSIMTPTFAWIVVGVLIFIFLIASIYVFNPVLHPDLGIASGEGTSLLEQIRGGLGSSKVAGSILLIIIAGIVAWVVTKK